MRTKLMVLFILVGTIGSAQADSDFFNCPAADKFKEKSLINNSFKEGGILDSTPDFYENKLQDFLLAATASVIAKDNVDVPFKLRVKRSQGVYMMQFRIPLYN